MSEALKTNAGECHFLGHRNKRQCHYPTDNGEKMDRLQNVKFCSSKQIACKQSKLNPKEEQTSTQKNKKHLLFHLWENIGEENRCHISR